MLDNKSKQILMDEFSKEKNYNSIIGKTKKKQYKNKKLLEILATSCAILIVAILIPISAKNKKIANNQNLQKNGLKNLKISQFQIEIWEILITLISMFLIAFLAQFLRHLHQAVDVEAAVDVRLAEVVVRGKKIYFTMASERSLQFKMFTLLPRKPYSSSAWIWWFNENTWRI